MSKFKVVNLIDKIFVSTATFLLIFAWINFYIRSLWPTFFLSLIFSFAILFLLYYFLGRKQEKITMSKKNTNEVLKYFSAFRLLSKNQKLELLNTILSHDFEVQIKNNVLYYTKNSNRHALIFFTSKDKFSDEDLFNEIENLSRENFDTLEIICNEHNVSNTELFLNKKINIINKTKLYLEFFVRYNIFPNIEGINFSVSKLKFKDILKSFFVKEKAKSYFLCGLVLIFSNFILPYHFYYIIFGSILMLFSIICKLLPYFKD